MATPSASPIAIAQGEAAYVSYIDEVTKGVAVSTPSMKLQRSIDRNINLKKNILVSKEIRRDRQRAFVRHGMNRIEGSISGELATKSYDDWLAYLFASSWVAVTTSGTPNLAASSSGNTFTRATGNFVTDLYRPGDIIVVTGFSNSANNGLHQVLTVTTTILTVAETLVTEGSSTGRTIALKGKRLDVDTDMTTFNLERGFPDISVYELYKGVTPNTGEIRIQPEDMISIAFGLLGMSMANPSASSVDSSPDETNNDSEPLTAFEGSLYLDGTALSVATGLNISLNNSRVLSGIIGSKYSPDVFEGTLDCTGSLSSFFTSKDNLQDFLDEATPSLFMRMDDLAGNFLNIVMPKIKYTGNDKNPPQQNGVVEEMPFTALSTSTLSCISIQRSNS